MSSSTSLGDGRGEERHVFMAVIVGIVGIVGIEWMRRYIIPRPGMARFSGCDKQK